MNWILVGVIAGSVITSSHDTKEACFDRKATLSEQRIPAICVLAPSNSSELIVRGIPMQQQICRWETDIMVCHAH